MRPPPAPGPQPPADIHATPPPRATARPGVGGHRGSRRWGSDGDRPPPPAPALPVLRGVLLRPAVSSTRGNPPLPQCNPTRAGAPGAPARPPLPHAPLLHAAVRPPGSPRSLARPGRGPWLRRGRFLPTPSPPRVKKKSPPPPPPKAATEWPGPRAQLAPSAF